MISEPEESGAPCNVSDYERAQERVAQLNAIVRASDREPLVAEVCRIAVEDGGFRMAWFGVPENGSGLLVPAARYGHEDGYLEHVRISAEEVRRGGHSISNDLAAERGELVTCN
jgi:hypothetical protein